MLYDDLTFTASPDPSSPGSFRIAVFPPPDQTFAKDKRTGALTSWTTEGQGGVYNPTPDEIRSATRAIRAADLRAAHAAWVAGAAKRSRAKCYGTAKGCEGRVGRMMRGYKVDGRAMVEVGGVGVVVDEVVGLAGMEGKGEGGW